MNYTDIDRHSRDTDTQFDVICELEKAINDEWLAYYQYWTAYNISKGSGKFDIDPEMMEHAEEELEHVEKLTKRLNQLGGRVTLDPTQWRSKAHEWRPLSSCEPIDILKETKYAEIQAIRNYECFLKNLGDCDPVTKNIIIEVLAKEYEHYHDLDLLCGSLV